MKKPANVILFGAGASFGSGETIPKPPPVGSELYSVLRRLFPGVWGGLSEAQTTELERDFESGMERIGRENSHALPPLQRAMASFFFDFVPSKGNLYRRLASRICAKGWGGALVTLNYERLLEISLAMEGAHPYIENPPNSQPSVELCLPHGCCHLFCESVHGAATGISFSGKGVTTRGPIKVVGDRNEFRQRIMNDAFPPVMCYFDPSKSVTSGANFIESQRIRYDELMRDATNIAIVGVRVRPHDTHVWSALCETNASIAYCGGKSGAKEFTEWAKERRPGKVSTTLVGYFADSFENILECMNL